LQIGFKAAGAYGSVFAFNADTNEGGGDSRIAQFGANIGYALQRDFFSLDTGLSYMNSIGDSDGLGDILKEKNLLTADYVGGIGAYAITHIGPVSLIGEYITALDDIGEATNFQPMAFTMETGYAFHIRGLESTVAIGYQGTDDMAGYLPENRFLGSFAVGIFPGTTLAVEYAHDKDYDKVDGGTDESADTFTGQLAYEFCLQPFLRSAGGPEACRQSFFFVQSS
ncbi:MAG TPA: LbtU family siderophore porin, partial [Desulfobulbaceae bacterium]|nr:LbtU family siderophore porin [Desulfobulbaceae bacterium]